jgi:hypothetical protein
MEITKTINNKGYKLSFNAITIWFDDLDIDGQLDLITLTRNGRLSSHLWGKIAVEFKELWEEIK